MRKQGKSGEHIGKHEKTGRIGEKHRKTCENREKTEKQGKQKNTEKQGESRKNIEKHGKTGGIRGKHTKTRKTGKVKENRKTYYFFRTYEKELDNGKTITYKIIIDSFRYVSSSLSNLVDNLSEGLHCDKCIVSLMLSICQ